MTAIGHNSNETKKPRAGGVAVEQLKGIIARVERLEEEKGGISADIREIFAEAKGNGFDVKAIRAILKIRKQDASEREEQEAVLDTYLHALGMLPEYEDAEEEGEPGLFPEVPMKTDISDAELYVRACAIVTRDQKASTSYLQRMLTIGYNRAAQLVEKMEADGIVGPVNHVGKRDVLMTAEQLLEGVAEPKDEAEAAHA